MPNTCNKESNDELFSRSLAQPSPGAGEASFLIGQAKPRVGSLPS